jgi:hypothetical protein
MAQFNAASDATAPNARHEKRAQNSRPDLPPDTWQPGSTQ